MPKVIYIEDRAQGVHSPVRVTQRSEKSGKSPSIRAKCGDCDNAVVIGYSGSSASGNPHQDTMEINGVMATLDQWRQVFALAGCEFLPQDRHHSTVGVFGIPEDEMGRGLWSKRADGKGINAIGGAVDLEDAQKQSTHVDVLKREFREETGVEIEVLDLDRPLGVFPTGNLGDLAILYRVRITSGTPQPSNEAVEHIWMTPDEVIEAGNRYERDDHANGLLSGRGKRQWAMAKAFFVLASSNEEFRAKAVVIM